MDLLLSLLLQLQKAQFTLNQMDAARSARSQSRFVKPQPAATVQPVTTSVAPVTSTAQQAPVPVAIAPTPTTDFRTQVEQFVLSATNAARAQNGLQALVTDSAAASVARSHSEDMLTQNYFNHTNLSGCGSGCRLTSAGYVWSSYGENIHWMSGYNLSAQDTAKKIVSDWMNSPGHRANMLGSFTYAGVGIAVSGSKVYSTTVYTTK